MTCFTIIGAASKSVGQFQAFAKARRDRAEMRDTICFDKQDHWGKFCDGRWLTWFDRCGELVYDSMRRNPLETFL